MAVSSSQINQARNDAYAYLYDQNMDPRFSNEARDAISNLSQGVSLEASRRAAAGEGSYDAILQNLMNQTGLSEGGYDEYVQRLKDTGSLGIRDLNGNLLDNAITKGDFGGYQVWNGRVTEPWEGVIMNNDGTYTIYDSRDRGQTYEARRNQAEGGSALDLSANSPHSDDYYRAQDRYNNMVANGYNFERTPPLKTAADVLNVYANQNNSGADTAGIQGAGSASSPIAAAPNIPLQNGVAYGMSNYGGSYGNSFTDYAPAIRQNSARFNLGATSAGATSPYSSALRNAQGGGFNWNKEEDPAYQAYKDTYTRAAQQATADALGQVAARTGGMASSYATQAAQQNYNDQMNHLNDIVPELYQDAYGRYTNERAYADSREQEAYDRAMQQDQINYQRQQDALNQQQNNYSQLLNLMKTYGYMPSSSELAAAGMNQNMMNAIMGLGDYAPEATQYLRYLTGGGTGGGGGVPPVNPTNIPPLNPTDILPENPGEAIGATGARLNSYLETARGLLTGNRVSFIEGLEANGLINGAQADLLLKRLGLY